MNRLLFKRKLVTEGTYTQYRDSEGRKLNVWVRWVNGKANKPCTNLLGDWQILPYKKL